MDTYFNSVQRGMPMHLNYAGLTVKSTSPRAIPAFEDAILLFTLDAVLISQEVTQSVMSQYFIQHCISKR